MPDRHLYIFAYDISDPGRLRKSLNILKDYAWGGQKSVFECFLTSDEKKRLCERVNACIDEEEDLLLVARISEPHLIRTMGIALPPKDEPLIYVG